jgi:hypothetical protein
MTEIEAIRAILWEDWDPIGVNDNPDISNEYDSYADQIYSMIARGDNTEELARHLSFISKELMGLGANDQHSLAVARKLVAIGE